MKSKIKSDSLFHSVTSVNDRALIDHHNDGYNDYTGRLIINEAVYSSVMTIHLRRRRLFYFIYFQNSINTV